MAVSPQQLRSLRFDEGIRGYDKRQVDKVIRRVADLVEELEGRLAAAERRANAAGDVPTPTEGEAAELDETLRRTLILAQRTADAAIKEARADATRIRREAQTEADTLLADARAKNDKVTGEVESERARMLTEARQDCDARIAKVLTELRETHEAKRTELLEHVNHLTQVRERLAEDIDRLEAHVAERRERIRAALSDITAVLDDPERLDGPEAGTTALAPVPDAGSYGPVTVEVPAMEAFPDTEATGVPGEADTDEDVVDLRDGDGRGGDGSGTDPGDDAGEGEPGAEEPARPAWADAIPRDRDDPVGTLAGPARRAAPSRGDAPALDRFFSESDEDRRSGWFRRKP